MGALTEYVRLPSALSRAQTESPPAAAERVVVAMEVAAIVAVATVAAAMVAVARAVVAMVEVARAEAKVVVERAVVTMEVAAK